MILLFEIISDEGIFTTTKSVLNKKGNFILKKPNRHIEDDIEVNIAKIEDEDEFKVKRDDILNYEDIIIDIIGGTNEL